MFLDTWFTTQDDLESYPNIELTSRQHWNPHKIQFQQTKYSVQEEVEGRNLSKVKIWMFTRKIYNLMMDLSFDVAPFSEKYTPMKDIPIFSADTGFTSENCRNYILIFHEALYMPNMRHTLINMNQCCHFREKVQENP